MLPFDNKNEFQVLIDMPEGSTLEKNKRGSTGHRRLCIYAKLVRNYQAYAGTAGLSALTGLCGITISGGATMWQTYRLTL